jgi:hypothetical protein
LELAKTKAVGGILIHIPVSNNPIPYKY